MYPKCVDSSAYWTVVLMLNSLALLSTWLKISADNGEDLFRGPGDPRKPSPVASFREHRRRYPNSHLRQWAVALAVSEAALGVGLFVWALLHP